MKNWLGVGVVIVLLVVGWIGYDRPDLFPANLDVPRLIYLLMALLLVAGAGYGFRRLRFDGKNALVSIVIWAGLFAVIALVYAWLN